MLATPVRAQQAETSEQPPPPAEPDAAGAQPAAAVGEAAKPPAEGSAAALRELKQQLEQERASRQALEARLSAVEKVAGQAPAAEEDAELEALLAEEDLSAVEDEKLKLYGFIDAGLQRLWVPSSSFFREITPTQSSTFVMGNINLYIDAKPFEHWRTLMEIRFAGSPHGTETGLGALGGGYARTNTVIFDVTSIASFERVQWASIILERAWLEWSYSDLLQVRAGLWFTPWGIWNVDHGTPTLIALSLPFFVLEQSIPRRLTGLQVLGQVNMPPWSIGYHAGVSNGRQRSLVDFTDNKSVNGRVWARYNRKVELQMGLTGWWGIMEDIRKDLTSIDPVEIEIVETIKRKEWALGADFSLDIGGTKVRAEGLVHSSRYARGQRAPAALLLSPVGTFDADRIMWGAYLTLAHRIAWFEGYFQYDWHHIPSRFGDAGALYGPGFNLHFSPHAQLKVQYGYLHFFDMFANDGDHSVHNFHEVAIRWVLAF